MPQPLQHQFRLRKLELELGRLHARADSATVGFRLCLSQCLRRSGRSHPLVGRGTGQELVSAVARELRALGPLDADDQRVLDRIVHRARRMFAEADRIARAVFETGVLCDHARNVLYRPKSRRLDECGLSVERIRELAHEASAVEQDAAVLLFALRTRRSIADALRRIHPKPAAVRTPPARNHASG